MSIRTLSMSEIAFVSGGDDDFGGAPGCGPNGCGTSNEVGGLVGDFTGGLAGALIGDAIGGPVGGVIGFAIGVGISAFTGATPAYGNEGGEGGQG